MGISNSPSTFQRYMTSILSGLEGKSAFCYIDDIIVYSNTVKTHIEKLKEVLERLKTAGLKMKPSKCRFLCPEVSYLGHVITPTGIRADPEKIRVLKEYPRPTSVTEVRQLLGLSGWYRQFIPDYALKSKPLTELTGKYSKFEWNEKQEEAFNTLRNALCSEPILIFPSFEREFTLTTDASQYCCSAILSQNVNGFDHPVHYASRQFSKSETNYSTYERELAAVVFGIKTFRCYLYGRHFKIITDHRALVALMNEKKQSCRQVIWDLRGWAECRRQRRGRGM